MGQKKFRSADKLTRMAIVGYAHNQGAGGASKWLRTGVVGRDAFNTAGTHYYNALKRAFRKHRIVSESTLLDKLYKIKEEIKLNELANKQI